MRSRRVNLGIRGKILYPAIRSRALIMSTGSRRSCRRAVAGRCRADASGVAFECPRAPSQRYGRVFRSCIRRFHLEEQLSRSMANVTPHDLRISLDTSVKLRLNRSATEWAQSNGFPIRDRRTVGWGRSSNAVIRTCRWDQGPFHDVFLPSSSRARTDRCPPGLARRFRHNFAGTRSAICGC